MKGMRLHLFMLTILLMTVMGWSQSLDADSIQAIFTQANQAYREKQFAEALKGYKKIIEAGFHNPTVFYNAGNAYYKLGERGKAVLMYEKARRLAPRDAEIGQNLLRVEPPINRQKSFFLLLPLKLLKQSFSLNEFILIAEGLYIIFSVCLIATLLINREKKAGFKKSLKPLGILLIIVLIFTGVKIYEEKVTIQGTVIPNKAVVRSGPGEQFSEILVLPGGTKFCQIGAPEEGWIRIRLPDGKSGYLNEQAYHII